MNVTARKEGVMNRLEVGLETIRLQPELCLKPSQVSQLTDPEITESLERLLKITATGEDR